MPIVVNVRPVVPIHASFGAVQQDEFRGIDNALADTRQYLHRAFGRLFVAVSPCGLVMALRAGLNSGDCV
jgi:hypothetical protein